MNSELQCLKNPRKKMQAHFKTEVLFTNKHVIFVLQLNKDGNVYKCDNHKDILEWMIWQRGVGSPTQECANQLMKHCI